MARAGVAPDRVVDGGVIIINDVRYAVHRKALNLGEAGLGRGWQVVYLQQYEKIVRDIRGQIASSILLCALIALVALGLTLAVSRSITGRLNLMMYKIALLSQGAFDAHIQVPGEDEIARISESFDEMSARIQKLICDNAEAYERLLEAESREKDLLIGWKNAEYQVLRAQINPHYLFNTLETIRMNLLIHGEAETAHIIRLFADTIREYMDVERLYAPLREELRYIDAYMHIQRFRFGDRVAYEADVPEDLLNEQVPRLLLQPLVENAVAHGIDRKAKGGLVRLRGWRDGDWLCVCVEDDGVGMAEERLNQVRAALETPGEGAGHLGLKNVHRRLVLLYGPQSGLRIESREGEGTCVSAKFRMGGQRDVQRIDR